MTENDLTNRARMYAERYGIVSYKRDGYYMIYNISYPAYLTNPHYTIQHRVDLRTMKETKKRLKRYDREGEVNR